MGLALRFNWFQPAYFGTLVRNLNHANFERSEFEEAAKQAEKNHHHREIEGI